MLKRGFPLVVLVLSLLGVAGPADAAKRYAVLVGANDGWAQDQPLRHAREDARRLGAALQQLGDFEPGDVRILEDPSTDEIRKQLDELARRGADPETVFVFYYSGHADEKQLHLRGPPLTFEELYRRIRAMPHTVKLGILDACQSGSILAAKGGRPTSTFKVDVQDDLAVRGTAFLTSSGADELSQEARALAGSVFSHHLVSGLRGAADEDEDGKVSLGEVYRYASVRTTLDTAATAMGAQRPGFRYELNGRGEVYLTRLERPGSVLVFPPDRRCFVTDLTERRLVAEVPGTSARATQLALPVGSYVLKCPREDHYEVVAVTASAGGRVEVAGLKFSRMPLASGVIKGTVSRPAEEASSRLKRRAFDQLRAGDAHGALAVFDQVLRADARDSEAYRGKAQAYLALARQAAVEGRETDAQRLQQAALKTDPRLQEDPQFASAVPPSSPPEEKPRRVDSAQLVETTLRGNYPREHQLYGFGVSLLDAHGVLALSADYMLTRWLQPSVKLTVFNPGVGLAVRAVPMNAQWSPFVGVGGHWSVFGMGLVKREPGARGLTLNGVEFTRPDQFDRSVYLDAGIQLVSPRLQLDAGLAFMAAFPPEQAPFFAVMPVVSLKLFFERPATWKK